MSADADTIYGRGYMINVSNTLFYAIQVLPGETPSGKWKEIGMLVRDIIASSESGSDIVELIDLQALPEPLLPIINLLVRMELKQHDAIIVALKSDNSELVTLTNRAKWFYDGSNSEITNFNYFSKHILPFISMRTRKFVIKELSRKLTNAVLGQEFLNGFIEFCGIYQAIPLLKVCSEDIIYNTVVKYKVHLKDSMLKFLYRKYPNIVIRYLRLGFEPQYENRIRLRQYLRIFPMLIPNHMDVFNELRSHVMCKSNFTNRRTLLFLKKSPSILVNNPKEYLSSMPLKIVAKNLTLEDFETMIGNLFPEDVSMFMVNEILKYLTYYPKEKIASFLVTKYKEKYNIHLYDRLCDMSGQLLLALPVDDRISQAKKLLKKGPAWNVTTHQYTDLWWWCYLSCDESIPAIKAEIANSKSASDRKNLICNLIYTCKVNDSLDCLFDVLCYIYEKHRNEQSSVIISVFNFLTHEFDLTTLSLDHWKMLNSLIARIEVKREVNRFSETMIKILKEHIKFCFKNNLRYNESLQIFLNNIHESGPFRHVRDDSPEYHRLFLNALLQDISANNTEFWASESSLDIFNALLKEIMTFNKTHAEPNPTVDKISVTEYPSLMDILKIILETYSDSDEDIVLDIRKQINKLRPEFLEECFPQLTIKNKLTIKKAISDLKQNYEVVFHNWAEYLHLCMICDSRGLLKVFVRKLRWYQNIPKLMIEMVYTYITDIVIRENKNVLLNLYITLGCLTDGYTYNSLIPLLVPESLMNNQENNQVFSEDHKILSCAIRAAIYTNPPVPFRFLETHFLSECVHITLNELVNVVRRTSVQKVISFATSLLRGHDVIKNHANHIMRMLGSEYHMLSSFSNLWSTETHFSIRRELARNIINCFKIKPSQESFTILLNCIKELSAREEDIFESLLGLKYLPDDYVVDYFVKLYDRIQRLEAEGWTRKNVKKFLCKFLRKITPTLGNRLPEKIFQNTIERFLFQKNVYSEISEVVREFTYKVYLVGSDESNFHDRLAFFSDNFNATRYDWVECREPWKIHLPMISGFHAFVSYIATNLPPKSAPYDAEKRVVQELLSSCFSVISPDRDPVPYLKLSLILGYLSEKSDTKFGVGIRRKMDTFVSLFSAGYILVRFPVILNDFFNDISYTDSNKVKVMEGMIQKYNTYCYIIVGDIILNKSSRHETRYDSIISTLRKQKNDLAVQTIVQDYKNSAYVESEDTSDSDILFFED